VPLFYRLLDDLASRRRPAGGEVDGTEAATHP
jgi:hypothetical protein